MLHKEPRPIKIDIASLKNKIDDVLLKSEKEQGLKIWQVYAKKI